MRFYSPAVRSAAALAASEACAAVAESRAEQFSAAGFSAIGELLLGGFGESEQFSAIKPAPGQRGLFDESEHPRAGDGKFAEKAGGGAGPKAAPAVQAKAKAPPVEVKKPADPPPRKLDEAEKPLPPAASKVVSSDDTKLGGRAVKTPHFKNLHTTFNSPGVKKRAEEIASKLDGGFHQVANLVGMDDDLLDEGELNVLYASSDGDGDNMAVEIVHPQFTVNRAIQWLPGGKKAILNNSFKVDPAWQGSGIGIEVFSRQVAAAATAGFSYIETDAFGEAGSEYNGYYTWPRFGYDIPIRYLIPRDRDKLKAAFPAANSILDVMSTKEGREWWKTNGFDLPEARFDLSPGSRSMRVLAAYQEERAARSKATPESNAKKSS